MFVVRCSLFNASTIQRFNDSTLRRFNDSTIQRFNDSTIQRVRGNPKALDFCREPAIVELKRSREHACG
jgi:hypothetical protein